MMREHARTSWMRHLPVLAAAMLTAGIAPAPAAAASIGGCTFDTATLTFAGTPAQQASCLLKRVRHHGSGAVEQPVPDWLLQRIWRPVSLTQAQVQAYLDRNRIASADLGGPLALGDAPARRYFVIHDTSSPVLPNAPEFPREIDDASHATNSLAGWRRIVPKVNLIISRDGRSRTLQNWSAARPESATKLEARFNPARRLFVHVENIQARMAPPGSWAWRAPSPGFGPEQEQRLALAYIVASLRAGRWLVPAYHFNIDQGLPDGHDDPQNVDLASWAGRIEATERQIREGVR